MSKRSCTFLKLIYTLSMKYIYSIKRTQLIIRSEQSGYKFSKNYIFYKIQQLCVLNLFFIYMCIMKHLISR